MEKKGKPFLFLDFDQTLFDYHRYILEFWGISHEAHHPKMQAVLYGDGPTHSASFLYPDTVPFLKRTKGTHALILLSRAKKFPRYQQRKIMESGVAEYFEDIILTSDDDKASQASRYVREDTVGVFVDDNVDALLNMKSVAPKVLTAFMDRRKRFSGSPPGADIRVTSLSEVPLQ